jgi:hypothetical protein
MVIATFHVGAPVTLISLVDQLPGHVLVPFHSAGLRPRMRLVDVRRDTELRMAAVKLGVRTLRAGGFVVSVVDGVGTGRLPVDILGRRASFSRGPFAMARLGRAPIVPMIARWRGFRVEITAGPVVSSDRESEMAGQLAAWLEGYVLEHPGEVQAGLAALLSDSPALAVPATSVRVPRA